MANEKRVRVNFTGGLVDDNPLTISATTLNSNALQALQVIDATQHMVIVLDPDGYGGAPEIAYLTGHTSSASTATLLRAQEGSTARAHIQDTPWVHSGTAKDFDGSTGGTGLIALTVLDDLATTQDISSSATSWTDIPSATVTFTAPPSGKVLIVLTATAYVSTVSTDCNWGIRDGATLKDETIANNATVGVRHVHRTVISALTAGTSYTYKWSMRRDAATGTAHTVYGGANLGTGRYGVLMMEVWAVNL